MVFKKGHPQYRKNYGAGFWKNKKMSKEHKEKISKSMKGKIFSEERNKKISETHKKNYKLGITQCGFKEGHHINARIKHNYPSWNKGLSKKTDKRIEEMSKSLSQTLKYQYKNGRIAWNIGKKYNCHSEEHKIKLSIRWTGKGNPSWEGGKSFEPYGLEFNNNLKKIIRERDNFECKICNKKENKRKHCVHHIDYNKQNNDPKNLITLCQICHNHTNKNRSYWRKYFKNE